MEGNFTYVDAEDDLQDIFSKYGALALEKQENLGKIIGGDEPDLDIEKGTVSFGDLEFPIQLIGFLNPNEEEWSWAWDNEDIFPENLLEEAKSAKAFGEEFDIPQFSKPMFGADITESHILVMTVSSIFGGDAYCAAEYGDFVFFVTIQSNEIPQTDDIDTFIDVFNNFHRKFEVDHLTALRYYSELKGYECKEREDFSLVKIGEDRLIVDFSERGNVKNIKPLKASN